MLLLRAGLSKYEESSFYPFAPRSPLAGSPVGPGRNSWLVSPVLILF